MSGQTPKATETNNAANNKNLFPVSKDAKQAKKGKKVNVEDEAPGNNGVEQQLAQINEKLSNMLTRNDTGFLKQIIKDTICKRKDELLKPLIYRIKILESDVMDQAKEIENLKKELTKKIQPSKISTKTTNASKTASDRTRTTSTKLPTIWNNMDAETISEFRAYTVTLIARRLKPQPP